MKVLIVEDEKIAAKRLTRLLHEIDQEIIIENTIGSVLELVNFLEHARIDLIFMDIQLSDGICFEVFEQIEVDIPVVFITAYDEYMQKAFKVNSIDYLLKPIDKDELALSIHQYNRYISKRNNPAEGLRDLLHLLNSERKNYKKRFLVRKGKGFVSIDIAKVSYIQSENKLTYLVLDDGKRFVIDYALDAVIAVLNPDDFCKISRNFIVGSQSIVKMEPYFNNRMLLILEPPMQQEVLVSRSYLSDFRKWIDR